jgi:two-component system alkaline phosphatase synthesis response regulator PhoP
MGNKKILIVDDDEELRNLVDKTLSRKRYETLMAETGSEAIDKAKQNMPDLILMDIVLPDMDGSEAIKVLQEFPQTSNIPVIFLSGMISKDDGEDSCINVGGKRYKALAKPCTSQVLLDAVLSALN